MKVALFEPQIPENTGNILRTAACFNLELNIIMPCGFIFSNKKMQRSSMDYLHSVNYKLFNNWQEFIDYNKNSRIILSTTKTDKHFNNFTFKSNDVLLFGNEGSGVPNFVHESIKNKIKIPLFNNSRSLNLSVAVGIITSYALINTNQFIQN